jgi:hypothetical protein
MRRFAHVALVALAVATGCSLFDGHGKLSRQRPDPPTYSQYHLAGWSWERVDRVLVLPVLNEPASALTANDEVRDTRAGDKIRNAFTSEMQRMARFEVVSAAPDDQAALTAIIHRDGRFDEAVMIGLANRTGADVVVHITVTHYSPYPRPRLALVVQAVAPAEAKVVASVDGLWDTTDAVVAERCRIFYRQRTHPRPGFIKRNHVIATDDEFAGDLALESPALFQRWVCHEAILALLGQSVPGVVSPGMNSRGAAKAGAKACVQPADVAVPPPAPAGKVE